MLNYYKVYIILTKNLNIMKSKINVTFDIANFEPLSENNENKLVGGFSVSLSGRGGGTNTITDNNCHGGNCDTNCGGGQNINCNTVSGCGVIIKE